MQKPELNTNLDLSFSLSRWRLQDEKKESEISDEWLHLPFRAKQCDQIELFVAMWATFETLGPFVLTKIWLAKRKLFHFATV